MNMNYQVKQYACIENTRNYCHHHLSEVPKLALGWFTIPVIGLKMSTTASLSTCMYMNDADYEFIPSFA